jgi:hypothetical protein
VQVFDVVGRAGGAVIVDSTRRGKCESRGCLLEEGELES